jgi:hypothetical protein
LQGLSFGNGLTKRNRILNHKMVSCFYTQRSKEHISVSWLFEAMPYLRRLVAGFPPRRPGFEPRSGHVGFVVDKVVLGQVLSWYLGFPF